MQHTYSDGEHFATVYLLSVNDKNAYIITGWEINQRYRGRGYASKLFDRVCADADNEGATLMLSVEPDGTGLDLIALFAFYESRGFVRMNESDVGMIRHPKGK